ncbi:MAG TPA: hypothetical protein V6C88_13035 [Chroococcidiopsis sp.]
MMQERYIRWFPIRPSEVKLVLILGFVLFSNYASMGITQVIAVSGFLSQVQEHYILLVWAIDMALLILTSGLQSLVIDRFKRKNLLISVLLILAGLYLILPILFNLPFIPRQISYSLVYLLSDQQWRFFPLLFWILVNDIFDPAQGRRLQPVIANFGFLGTITGLGITAIDAYVQFGTIALLLLNTVIFLLAALVAQLGISKIRASRTSTVTNPIEVLTEGWSFIRQIPAFSFLSAAMVLAGMVMTILLYHALADAEGELGSNFQSFYAWYSLAIACLSVLIQSQANVILERISLKNSFLIQPITMVASAFFSLLVPGSFWSSATAQGVARVNYETVDISARKALEAFVPDERRGRVSMFIDSYWPSLGTIIGSLITFTIIAVSLHNRLPVVWYSSIYLGVAIVAAIAALFCAIKMRSVYDASLLSWLLKRRQRARGIMDQIFKDL